jgi:tetratricopeptide (TPR) repeat protein
MASRHGWHALSVDVDVDAQLQRAAELVEGRPPSRVQALVLAERARRSMITFRPETGMTLARSAIALARAVHDLEIEGHALVTLGCARVSLGDSLGVEDIERALEVVGRRGHVAGRALTNLGWAYEINGDLRRALTATEECVELAEQGGDIQTEWFARGNLAASKFGLGDWDGALVTIGLFDDAPEGARYMQFNVRVEHALILAARDRAEEALGELRDVLSFLADKEEEAATWYVLTAYSSLARRRGLTSEADEKLDELMTSIAAHESVGDPSRSHIELVLELLDADRTNDVYEILRRLVAGPWRDACVAVAERQFAAAADILDSTGDQPIQAELRLRAAQGLMAEGRIGEAHEQLERARAFWRRVGATTYLREADELLAAAS